MTRGDIHRLAPPRRARGAEQKGGRYAVILQTEQLAPLSTVIVAPTSRSAASSFLRPNVEVAGETTSVMVEQLRSVDLERLGRRVGHVSWNELEKIEKALRLLLDL